ncbi:ABC transporter permease [Halotalea alkalilenta]|uniref:ABC transporter permease n=1 Tax=Halotalea alkalilenta TaxID=376489 RepID=A0A172YB31_9GAMM|nr:ABC transporter permease [Halotalea alkalilenta]
MPWRVAIGSNRGDDLNARYVVHRLLQSLLVMLGVTVVVFYALHLGGDPAALMLPPEASFEEIAAFRQAMGFDRPLWVQYIDYLSRLLQGDFGVSLRFQRPVLELIVERLPATLLLALAALSWSTLLGFFLGVVAALRPGSAIDFFARCIALMGQALPVFWLGLLLILLFSLHWRLLPTGGYGELRHLILPAVALGAYYMSAVTRLVRDSLIDALGQDYVRTARAKGLSEWRVIRRHALRNALIPVITVQAMEFAALLGGALVTEVIFSWPGIGRLAVQAIQNRDLPLVQVIVLFAAAIFVLVNLLVDLLYALLNPRIRL